MNTYPDVKQFPMPLAQALRTEPDADRVARLCHLFSMSLAERAAVFEDDDQVLDRICPPCGAETLSAVDYNLEHLRKVVALLVESRGRSDQPDQSADELIAMAAQVTDWLSTTGTEILQTLLSQLTVYQAALLSGVNDVDDEEVEAARIASVKAKGSI